MTEKQIERALVKTIQMVMVHPNTWLTLVGMISSLGGLRSLLDLRPPVLEPLYRTRNTSQYPAL